MDSARTLVTFLILVALPGPLAAQVPNRQVLAPGGVVVTPKGGSVVLAPSSTTSLTFLIQNTRLVATTYSLSCSVSGQVTACSGPTTVTLDANEQIDLDWGVTAGSAGSGQIAVHASGAAADSGWVNVTVAGVSAPALTQPRQAADSIVNYGRCLTGAAALAAWSCGHALMMLETPRVTTLDRNRVLTMVHNSATASPMPLVAVDVTPNAADPPLDHVTAVLSVAGTVRRTALYAPWTAGTPKQLVLAWDAAAEATGAYPYTMTVRSATAADSAGASVSGLLMVVNRSSSIYGKGWDWLGVERLVFNQPVGSGLQHILWVGGDGSAKLYRKISATQWVAPPEAYRDTITLASGEYTRRLRHGVQVIFDSTGRHIRTSNRATQVTHFYWGTATRLDSVRVPPAGSGGRTFRMVYAGGVLDSIVVSAGKGVKVSMSPTLLTQWRWPDGTYLTMGYDAAGRVNYTSDVRGAPTAIVYGAHGMVESGKVFYGYPGPADSAITTFTPWQAAGFASGLGWHAAGDTANAVTIIDGPRSDVQDRAIVHIDRFGAPIEMQDPLNMKTRYIRANAGVPALVTEVRYPNSRRAFMTWNASGDLTQVTDSTWGARSFPKLVTRWEYGNATAPESPVRVIGPANDTTRYSYNALGLTDTIIDARQHRTVFVYGSAADSVRGQVVQIRDSLVETWVQSAGTDSPQTLATVLTFDISGNTRHVQSPSGGLTKVVRDTDGRVISDTSATGLVQAYVWDAMDRQTVHFRKRGVTPNNPNCITAEFICADRVLDALNPAGGTIDTTTATYTQGFLSQVRDPRGVLRSYRYELRGLLRAEIDQAGMVDSVLYNRAGQVDSNRTRRGDVVRFRYDVAGRDTMMWFPSRSLTYRGSPTTTAPGDTVRTGYDSLGNILTLQNANGTIRRSYYESGRIRSEVTIPTAGRMISDSTHYDYDPAGRLRRVAWSSGDSVIYHYHRSGILDSMRVHYRTSGSARSEKWQFDWDALGRRKTVTYPYLGMTVNYRYDRLGTLRALTSTNPGSFAVTNRFNATLRRDSVDVLGRVLRQTVTCQTSTSGSPVALPCGDWLPTEMRVLYNRVGGMAYQQQVTTGGVSTDTIRYDQSDNRIDVRSSSNWNLIKQFRVGAASNRLTARYDSTRNGALGSAFPYFYDALGSQDSVRSPLGPGQVWQYDALGRLVGGASAPAPPTNPTAQWNDCLWDGAGRLSKPCNEGNIGFVGHNVTRTATNWLFVHAPGIDEPLLLLKRQPNTWLVEKRLQAVSDGAGQLVAVADSAGEIDAGWAGSGYDQGGWKGAGLTSRAQTFDPRRQTTPQTFNKVQQFRHRAYDRESGRWLQEDPIGLSGGVNLYQYNRNDPNTFSDPFGLCTPMPDCLFQAVADWGAQRGGSIGYGIVNTAAALNAGAEVFGVNELGRAIANRSVGGTALALAGVLPVGRAARAGQVAGKALTQALIKDAMRDAGNWRTIGLFTEAATNKLARGGISIQRVIQNEAGDVLTEHTVLTKAGTAIDGPHYRRSYRARDVDKPE